MPTTIDKYLDPAGLDETVINIRELVEGLEEEMQDLPYARPDGLYPDMTVGAVQGAPQTSQWATRESTGSGTAQIESVQGATVVQDSELAPVRIAGIASTDANGDALDGVEWETQTLRAAGSVADMLYADHVEKRVGVVDLGTLTYHYDANLQRFFTTSLKPASTTGRLHTNVACALFTASSSTQDMTCFMSTDGTLFIYDHSYTTAANFKTAMSGVYLWYELATPTTTPISPALPMTYRVEQGGTESIIVPDGEISAAPLLTISDPLNVAAEFARVWEAIGQLRSRSATQLSRPVSLADDGTVDETQKDTAEIAEIETTKEAQK